MRCQKKWWYTYGPLQLKEPPSKKAAMGTAVHAVLEAYLRDGTQIPDTPAGRIASVGLDKLRPAEDLEIERSITLPLNDAADMLCRIDMLGKNEPYVGDHKTTSDLKWIKTRAQVARDIQLMTYAYAGYYETKPDTVTGELIYYVRDGQKVSMSVSAEFSWEDIEENWRLMGEIAREMLPRKTDPTGETCAGNSSACGDYGGCFFQDRCPVSPRNASKIKKELAQSISCAINDNEINPEQEQHTMSGFLDEMMTRPNKRPTTDNGSTFGGFAAPSVLPPEHPAPTRQAAATAPIFDDVKAAPVPAPVETVAQRTPTSCGKKEYPALGRLFRARRMNHPATTEITEAQARTVVQDLIKKETGRNITNSRFDNIIKAAGYAFEGGLLIDTRLAPTEGPFNPGYTADPDAEEISNRGDGIECGEETPGPNYEPDLDEMTETPAISAPCVLLVNVSHTGADAKPIDNWLDMVKLQAKDAHPDGKTYASYLAADLDYGTGGKLLAHVLKSHTEAPAGLWTMRSTHAEKETVLKTFERLGTCIIYGN